MSRRPGRLIVLTLLGLSGCPKPEVPAAAAEAASLVDLDARGMAPVERAVPLEAPPLLITGARVLTATGQTFDPGWLLVREGRIAELGDGQPPQASDAERLDATGMVLTPGIIDTHSHLGVYPSPRANAHGDGNEASAPTTAGVWAEHSFWPQDPGLETAVAGGITTLQVLPGSANLIGGRGVVLHMVPALGSRAMRLPDAPETVKMACGENPKRVYGEHKGGAPSTRMGNLRGHRQAFIAAQRYQEDWALYTEKAESFEGDGDPPRPPERDLQKETLVGVLEGRVLPQVHCYRADDMISILQVADEFDFQVRSFHHALEAYKIAPLLAEHQVAVSTWADWWGFKLEAYDGIPSNLAMVHTAGARAIVHSDSSIGIQRLNQEAAKGLRDGQLAGLDVDEQDALVWITANPAWALGIDDQVGTLEPGKRADLVLWNGDPFSVYTHAQKVFVDGAMRYDRDATEAPWSDFMLGQELP